LIYRKFKEDFYEKQIYVFFISNFVGFDDGNRSYVYAFAADERAAGRTRAMSKRMYAAISGLPPRGKRQSNNL
jgi:hypothetical protein